MVNSMAAAIFTAEHASTLVGAISGALTDNLPFILGVVGFSASLGLVMALFRRHIRIRG